MIRTSDYLAAFNQANSLVQMREAAGLDQSIASVVRDVNALTGRGGLEMLRLQAAGIAGTHGHILREAKKIVSGIGDAEQIRRRHAGLIFDGFGDMDRYRRMVSQSTGPLSALRSAALYENEAAQLARQAGGLLGSGGLRSHVEAFSAVEEVRKQRAMLAASFGEPLASRWLSSTRDIAEHFASARDVIDRHTKAWRDAAALDPARLAKSLGMPVMDQAAFAAIARSSGVEGLLAQFRSLGVDGATLRRVASTVADDEADVEELLGDADGGEQAPRQLTRSQLVRLWNLFLIFYNLVMPLYGIWDSSQTEARITGDIKAAEARTAAEIQASEQRTAEKIEAMTKLMERVLEVAQQAALAEENLVVRERVARIRSDPRHGASVVAEAFPNQVVTLLDERGKWVKVEYYDWLARDERSGWALRKYFVRAEPSSRAEASRRRLNARPPPDLPRPSVDTVTIARQSSGWRMSAPAAHHGKPSRDGVHRTSIRDSLCRRV